ncbi:hypothetical protein [Rikenella microfusus]|uniref:hypothetical protein n=1 Tax=Rikenella microfusus TaxID=28139 RepID=UPI00248EB286|nr:hypothetical protein [Rikenella microfusus]
MTSINITDPTKLGILSNQILDMLKQKGYQQLKLNPDNTIFFNDRTTYYTLFIEQEHPQDTIFIQIHVRFADNLSHLTNTQILEVLNKVNSSIKGIKLSYDFNISKVNMSAETWITNINGFHSYFDQAMKSFTTAIIFYSRGVHPDLFPF